MSTSRPESLDLCMAQKANMEAIFHSVADAIVTLDPSLVVLNLNHAAEHIFRTDEEAVASRPIDTLLAGRDWDLRGLLNQVLVTGQPRRVPEREVVCRDGTVRSMILSASRLLGRNQETAGLVMVLRDVTELRALEGRLRGRTSFHAMEGASDAIEEVFQLVEQVAPTDSTVLILGESGTGKELVADALHRASARASGPMVKVNCSALSESLLESELFGHVKGAFTGAHADREGRFELASGGTLFLDEIGDLTERIQVKLLRVLQEREIERVGDTEVRRIDVRVIAATHKNLRDEVAAGRFREDLYFRLNVIPVHVPPLRERLADIPVLADRFREEMADRMGKRVERIGADALRVLMDHRWPGNVRELRNAIEHAVVRCRGDEIESGDLPREIRVREHEHASAADGSGSRSDDRSPARPVTENDDASPMVHRSGLPSPSTTRPVAPAPASAHEDAEERRRLLATLTACGWNRGRTAERLGVNRVTLWRRMRRLGIHEPGS